MTDQGGSQPVGRARFGDDFVTERRDVRRAPGRHGGPRADWLCLALAVLSKYVALPHTLRHKRGHPERHGPIALPWREPRQVRAAYTATN